MAIEIKKVKSKKERKAFIKFQLDLYKDNPYYIPPLISDEMETLDETKNPIFENAEAHLFLAYKEKKIVGRIATIINWSEVKQQNRSKMRFGWFDIIDDFEVSRQLIGEVEKMAKEKGLKQVEGPVGFSNLDKAGLLIKGFKEIGTMVTLYNHPYYAEHLEKLGYEKHLDWVEYKINALDEMVPDKIIKFSEIISTRYHLKPKKFQTKDDMKKLVDPMFELLDATYSILPSYVPITRKQIDYYREKYISFINPDYVSVIVDENDKMVAFAITMPSYSKALQKAKGTLFPLGWFHLLKANKKNNTVAFYLIGVKPEYQNKGVTSILFHEMGKTFKKYGIKYMETNPELENNKNVQALWSAYNAVQHKTRRSYIKTL
ncbi:MAG: GNAT family N-acetyltransferase [Flavobacteriales bacterium]